MSQQPSRRRAEEVVRACEVEVRFCRREHGKTAVALAKAEADLDSARHVLRIWTDKTTEL